MRSNSSRTTTMFIVACGISLLMVPTSAHADLLAFYPFEGNANDITGNGFDGLLSGPTLVANGYEGMAYDFDGSNDFIQVPMNINPAALPTITMGAWVNADSLGQRVIMSNDNGNFDRTLTIDSRGAGDGDQYSAFSGSAVGSAGPDPAPLNEWVFIAARYNQNTGWLTLDVNDDRQSFTAIIGSGTDQFQIGRSPVFGDEFDGTIDNVFIFDEVLTDAQIDQIRIGGAAAILSIPEPSCAMLYLLLGSACCRRKQHTRNQ